jgi:hypothetical protein
MQQYLFIGCFARYRCFFLFFGISEALNLNCFQSYSYGGTTSSTHNAEGLEKIVPNRERIIKIRYICPVPILFCNSF